MHLVWTLHSWPCIYLGSLDKSSFHVVFNFKQDSKFSSIRRFLNLLLIMRMLEKDCSHEYVEPNSERTANASFFSLTDYMCQEYYSSIEIYHVFLLQVFQSKTLLLWTKITFIFLKFFHITIKMLKFGAP